MGDLPLKGIRVIELGWGGVVPALTRQLADFGAQIIKVESHKRPDNMRGTNPERLEKSVSFAYFHRNKLDIGVDMKTVKGIELVKRLISISDVVAENFSFGVMEKWGLDYPRLKEIKPDIIMFSGKGLGLTGPYAWHIYWGPNLVPLVGTTYLWSFPDSPTPISSATNFIDFLGGFQGTVAVMAALMYRAKTGKGQNIDQAHTELGAALMGHIYLDSVVNKRRLEPRGNRCLYAAPYGCYRCKGEDRWCVIAIFTDKEWRAFGEAIGSPAWTKDQRFATILGRVKNAEELDRLVEEWTVNYTPHEVMDRLQRAGVAAGVVQNGEDLQNDPHLRERGFLVDIHHPVMETITYEGVIPKLSETPGVVVSPAPLIGQHTEYVCTEILGMTKQEIEDLVAGGVLV